MSKNIKCILGILIIFLVFNVGLFCNNAIIKENKVQAAVIKDDGFHEITIDGGNACSHTYSWVTTKNATCTASGSTSYKCTKCGYVYRTNTISALGHNYSSATCTMPQKCTRCGATVGTSMGHNYSAATCTAPRKCTRCGITSGNALGHSYAPATCTTPQKCTRCGVTSGSALGHTPGTAATCYKSQTCTRCQATIKAALGHNYASATCTTPQKCTRCGATNGSALGHQYVYTKLDGNNHKVTCSKCSYSSEAKHLFQTVSGVEKCKVCGYTKPPEAIKPLCKHDYQWVTITAVTCMKNGERVYKCTICNDISKRETIVAPGKHTPGTAATCTKSQTCTICQATIKEALGHNYVYTKIDENNHKITCSRCTYSSQSKHLFTTVSGVEKCKVCGYTKPTEAIKPLCKHDYKWVTITAVTCMKNGERVYKCTICNDISKRETIVAPGKHTPGTAATCTKSQTCTICQAVIEKALGHKYAAATCLTPEKCIRCGVTQGKALGHNYKYNKLDAINHEITCSRCDYSSISKHIFKDDRCKICNYVRPTEIIIEPEGGNPSICNHTYAWVTTRKATCKLEGEMSYQCTKCRYISERKITNKIDHIYVQKSVDDEYHIKECTMCGQTIEKEKHVFINNICECGKKEGITLCEHDMSEWKINYESDQNKNTHWKIYTCKICKAETKIIENHIFDKETKKCKCDKTFNFELSVNPTRLNINKMLLIPGSTGKIMVKHNGDENIKFTFSSSKPDIVRVDNDGNVSVNKNTTKETSAVITVTSPFGTKKTYDVSVLIMEGNLFIEVNKDNYYVSEPITLKADMIYADEIFKEDAEKALIWTVKDNKGSFNSNTGKEVIFTPNSSGEVIITVSTKIGETGISRSIILKVVQAIAKDYENNMTILLGSSITINGSGNLVKQSGTSVEVSGRIVIATNIGISVLKDETTGKEYTIIVSDQLIYINKIEILVGATSMLLGQSTNITIKAYPENATETYDLTFSHGLNYEPGKITGVQANEQKITAKASKVKQEVKVMVYSEKLELTSKDITVAVGDKGKVLVNFARLTDETIKTLTYESEDTSVITVDSNGIITPNKEAEGQKRGIIVSATFKNYKNGKWVEEVKTVKTFVTVGKTTKVENNLYVKPSNGETTGVVIFIPGSGGLCNPGSDYDTSKNSDSYYTFNNQNEYEKDIFTYNSTVTTNAAEKIRDSLYQRYGVSSPEEFKEKGYTLSVAGFSLGGSIGIAIASDLNEMGFDIDVLAVIDAASDKVGNSYMVRGAESVDDIMKDSDTQLITCMSTKDYGSASRGTQSFGEAYQEKYQDRVTINVAEGTDHNTVLHSTETSEILDKIAGKKG